MLYVLAIVLLLAVSLIGASVLRAGRQLVEPSGAEGRREHAERASGVAGLVDGSVRRVRVAVAELISTDVHHDDLRPSTAEYSRRGHTYTVLGIGLVGLAVVLLLGLLLVL